MPRLVVRSSISPAGARSCRSGLLLGYAALAQPTTTLFAHPTSSGETTMNDRIIGEVRGIGEPHAASMGYDLSWFFADLKARQE